jgi:hypothetical protein
VTPFTVICPVCGLLGTRIDATTVRWSQKGGLWLNPPDMEQVMCEAAACKEWEATRKKETRQ